MSQNQLDIYLAELAQTGLYESDRCAYCYLRKVAHCDTLTSYRKMRDRKLEKLSGCILPKDSQLLEKLNTYRITLLLIFLHGEKEFLERCWIEKWAKLSVLLAQ